MTGPTALVTGPDTRVVTIGEVRKALDDAIGDRRECENEAGREGDLDGVAQHDSEAQGLLRFQREFCK